MPSTASTETPKETKWPRLLTVICLGTTLILLGLAIYFSHSYAREAQSPVDMRLVVTSWPTARLLYAAETLGFFKNHGLHVDIIDVGDDNTSGITDIRQNNADGGAMVLTEPFLLTAEGVPMKVVLNTDYSNGADGVVADNSIKTLADLKGKSVARASNTNSDFLLGEALRSVGLRDSDINGVERSSREGATDFLKHNVDAVVTLEPYLSQAASRDNAHIVFTSAQVPGLLPDVISFRADYAAAHHQQIVQFLAAWFDLIDYFQTNQAQRNEVLAVVAIKGGVAISDIEHQLSGIRLFGFTDNAAAFTYGPDISSIYGSGSRLIDFLVARGIPRTSLEIQNIIDTTFLRSGLR